MTYDTAFYDVQAPGSRSSASQIVPLVIDLVRPSSVIDIGCGIGTWLAGFVASNVADVVGVDGDYVDRDRLLIPPDQFMPTDLAIPFHVDRTFDLAMSLEVGEHLPESSAAALVATLVGLSPVVLFSAAIPNQGGHEHINEHWPDYWAGRFAEHGYVPIDCIRPRIWTNPNIRWWYAQNIVLYVSERHMRDSPRLAALHERHGGTPLPLVHPLTLQKWVDRYEAERSLTAWSVGLRALRRRTPTRVKRTARRLARLPMRLGAQR